MRVTNTLFYSTSVTEHQSAMKKLYDIDKQIASGMKIQNSFENSGVYVDTMRLNYEIATLEQTKESSSKAQTFAQNTDSTMNQFTKALEQFKTKLIQANNGSNSTTSLNAIANDLVSLKNHMISLGNTSINGQFIFSGTSLLQKPINLDGTYVGNGESLNALIGSGVELPYNLNGKDLFLGTDSDYNRIVSTNIPMFNQTKLHPEVMIEAGNVSGSQETYLKETDTIRDMVGDTDTDTTNDPQTVFYLSGRKGDGTTFATKIPIDSSSKISDLLESIGEAYGNTTTNKVVDVSMNAHGQIELKDLKTGNQLLEMHLVGAVDRNAASGTTGNANQNNIDAILAQQNVDIISFQKSNFDSTNASSTISSREDIFNAGIYRIGFPMTDSNKEFVTNTTTLQSFMGSDVLEIEIGTGNFLEVDATTDMDDLLNQIKATYAGTNARIENGQIIIEQGTFVGSFATTMRARDTAVAAVNGSGNSIAAFSVPDGLNYTRRGFEKEGNELISNISQIVKNTNTFAKASDKLLDVAGTSSLDGKQFVLDYINVSGNKQSATINFSNGVAGSTFSIDLNNDGDVSDTNETFSIYNADGNVTKADDMTYQQLNDIVSMAVSNNLPKDSSPSNVPVGTNPGAGDGNINAIEYNYAILNAKNNIEVTLDYKGRIAIKDKTASESNIEFTMYDSSTNNYATGSDGTALSFMANDAVTISNPSIDFFKDLDAMIEAVRTGNFRMGTAGEDPRNIGMQNALSQLDHILDHVTKVHTKIGAYSNALLDAKDRAEYLSLNVKTVRSEVIDVDIAEAYLQFNQISNSYQAMLSTISKINSMSLLNYM